MFWALASTVFIIYLYRKLNTGSVEFQDVQSAENVEAELAALNVQITALEVKLGCTTTENLNR